MPKPTVKLDKVTTGIALSPADANNLKAAVGAFSEGIPGGLKVKRKVEKFEFKDGQKKTRYAWWTVLRVDETKNEIGIERHHVLARDRGRPEGSEPLRLHGRTAMTHGARDRRVIVRVGNVIVPRILAWGQHASACPSSIVHVTTRATPPLAAGPDASPIGQA